MTRRLKRPTLAELGADLLFVSSVHRWQTVLLPWMCVLTYVLLASTGYWLGAVLAVVGYTFYSYGSTSHDLVHGNLRLPPRLNQVLLSLTELLGLRSGHAYRAAHLHHHAHFPESDDVEAAAAHGSCLNALLSGPLHQLHVWCWAVRHAPRNRGWIVGEGIACSVLAVAAVVAAPWTPIPVVYTVLVILGSWTFPLMTAYIPHEPAAHGTMQQTRRFRGRLADLLFRHHLYHLEHHLYPAVPHRNWARLAQRLDPYLDAADVKAIYLRF
jgi:beta-carotene hydroxylase